MRHSRIEVLTKTIFLAFLHLRVCHHFIHRAAMRRPLWPSRRLRGSLIGPDLRIRKTSEGPSRPSDKNLTRPLSNSSNNRNRSSSSNNNNHNPHTKGTLLSIWTPYRPKPGIFPVKPRNCKAFMVQLSLTRTHFKGLS